MIMWFTYLVCAHTHLILTNLAANQPSSFVHHISLLQRDTNLKLKHPTAPPTYVFILTLLSGTILNKRLWRNIYEVTYSGFVSWKHAEAGRTPTVLWHLVSILNVWELIQRRREALKHSQAPLKAADKDPIKPPASVIPYAGSVSHTQ